MPRNLAPLCVLALWLPACRHFPSEKDIQGAQIHYDLGVQAQQSNPQAAYQEFERALELDPNFAEAHNATALLLHLSFGKHDEAEKHYQRALEIRRDFSEAKTNLGNLYLDMGRYDEAAKLYEAALNDMLYPTPFIAQGNLGWALYKKGEVDRAIDQIKSAVTINPKFCLGHRNLGLIWGDRGDQERACQSFGKYREACPEVADANYREGVCLARSGQLASARERFDACLSKAPNDALKDDCRRLREELAQ
ncbi:MAG: social motility TPR repeat lipoprotein Tgl [Myxococcales bacterium]|nr:social motility TPR repeat lipoprotein Tgl [Myxococcales bacterium]